MVIYGRNRNPGKVDPSVGGASWVVTVGSDGALVALPMQETAGTTLADVSGNGRNFTLTGTYTLGQPGPGTSQSVTFGGGYAFCTYASWMNVTAITIEMMFKSTDISTVKHLASRDGSGSNRPWTMYLDSTGKVSAYGNNQTGPIKSTTATGLDNGLWHYLAWAVDSSGNGLHIVDGSVDNNYTGGGVIATPASVDILLGRNTNDGSNNWLGSIAYFAMYDYKLTSAQLLNHRAYLAE